MNSSRMIREGVAHDGQVVHLLEDARRAPSDGVNPSSGEKKSSVIEISGGLTQELLKVGAAHEAIRINKDSTARCFSTH